MNLQEFETVYRNEMERSLNQLQTMVLLISQLEARINNIGQDLKNLSLTVEEFVTEQRAE